MKAHLYLYDDLRIKFQKPIYLYKNTYSEKAISIFSDIEKDADSVAEGRFSELGQSYDPYSNDAVDIAEAAMFAGLEYYEGMSLMRYNTKLMWISTLYQFWEQQVRKFLFEEINRTHKLLDENNNEVPFKKFCAKGIDDIKKEFLEFELNLEKLASWEKINELRLLANVIKHGDGHAATKLKTIRPRYFNGDFDTCDLLDLYKTTLNEITLNIDDNEFDEYCDAIIRFWGELPERMYSNYE